jgi:hypothetical protein
MVTGALFGELVGVTHEVQQCLPEPHLIRPGLDLGEVEDVVDQREQVTARAEHAVEGLNVLF